MLSHVFVADDHENVIMISSMILLRMINVIMIIAIVFHPLFSAEMVMMMW